MRERHAAGLGELAHLRDGVALQAYRQRADRIHMRLVERARTMLEHLDQSGLVERRIGIGRAGKACDAARNRGCHFRFERRLVFESGLAQPRRSVDQTGTDDEPRRVEHPLGMPALRRIAHRGDLARGDVERRLAVDPVLRIDHSAVSDLDLHSNYRRGCSSPPCAPRCRKSPAAGSPNASRRRLPNRSPRRGSSVPDA